MMPPNAEISNGIITGYVIYISEKTNGELTFEEFNYTVPRNDEIAGFTKASIRGLKPFTWYQFEMVAYTIVGEGNRTHEFHYIQTFEDGEFPKNVALR